MTTNYNTMQQAFKTLTLKKIPLELYQKIIKIQSKEKERRISSFSLEQTVLKIIKEAEVK